uniref:RING-type domain-containing protein n=1 Tax=Seriola lalandi dorsalis TaxID=1841481 RepID=A0A3B4W9C4_SERLL
MAAQGGFTAPPWGADFTCPVCCDIFKDPVVLLCGHSFCKTKRSKADQLLLTRMTTWL